MNKSRVEALTDGIERDRSMSKLGRLLLYGGFILCMILAFVKPKFSLYLIVILTAVRFVAGFLKRDD